MKYDPKITRQMVSSWRKKVIATFSFDFKKLKENNSLDIEWEK